MLLGDYASAWLESDAIQSRFRQDPNCFWDGTPFEGKRLLIRCLHGLGDTLQYARYAPLLRRRVASLTIEAQPPLKDLLLAANIADHVITWNEAEPPWNQQVEIVELPRIFRTTLQDIPPADYLNLAPGPSRKGSGPLQVGLVWASGDFDPSRSIPFTTLAP